MKVIITGSRDFTDGPRLFMKMDIIHSRRPIELLIEGGQRKRYRGETVGGVDYWGFMWAQSHGILTVREDAHWYDLEAPGAHIVVKKGLRYNKNAGPHRNQRMIDLYNPDALVLFPGGYGTADMARRARQAGLEIIEVKL